MVESSQSRCGDRVERGQSRAVGADKWLLARTTVLLLGLTLGSCSSFSGYVSDHWPTWAGGEPANLPPRPGAPGYAEFIAHQEGKNAAPANAKTPVATPASATAPTGATATPAVDNVNAQAIPPAARRIDDQGVVQGGLY